MIVVDTREKGDFPYRVLKELPSKREMLAAGDYAIPTDKGTIIIERSTLPDFVGKIKSGRLWKQVDKCCDASDDAYFVIEANYDWRYLGMPQASIVSAMVAISRKLKVLCVYGDHQTFMVLEKMHRSYGADRKMDVKEEVNSRVKTTETLMVDEVTWLLMGISGVGRRTAEKILKAAPSHGMEGVMAMSREDLGKLGKIGRHVYDTLHHTYNYAV